MHVSTISNRLFIIGDADNFTDVSKFHQTLAKQYETAESVVMKGVDHFFRRNDKELMDIIGKWLVGTFSHCQNDLKKFGRREL